MPADTAILSNSHVIARLLRDVRPVQGRMAISIVAGIAGHLSAIALMVCGAGVIAAAAGLIDGGAAFVAGVIACAAVRGLLHYVEQLCGHYIAFRTLALIREKVFTALRRVSPGGLVRTRRGDISATVMADIEAIEVFFAHTIAPVAIAIVVSAATVIGLAFASPAIAVVQLFAFAAVAVLPRMLTRHTRGAHSEYRAQMGAASGQVLESVRGMRDIVLLNAQRATIARLDDTSEQLQRLALRARIGSSVASIVPGVAAVVTGIAAVLIGTGAGWNAGAVLIVAVAAVSSFGPVSAVGQLNVNLTGTFAAARRVFALEDMVPAVSYGKAHLPPAPWRDAIRFEGVGYRYPDAALPTLEGVDFTVKAGEKVVISGPSGSGKSTLLRLLLRYFDPTTGRVLVAGSPLATLSKDALRSALVLVTQDTFLFDDTVAANIRIAKPDASDAEIATALRRARATDFVNALPDGAQTRVGELGGRLSGGERQRLGLARALLSPAPIVVLDEPTSNLDELNQRAILDLLRTEFADRTVLMASHRDATFEWADRLVRIGQGVDVGIRQR